MSKSATGRTPALVEAVSLAALAHSVRLSCNPRLSLSLSKASQPRPLPGLSPFAACASRETLEVPLALFHLSAQTHACSDLSAPTLIVIQTKGRGGRRLRGMEKEWQHNMVSLSCSALLM